MIVVTQSGNQLTASGHAGFAPHGSDIVCAAFSAVLQTFLASMEELTTDAIKTDIAVGKAVIEYGNLTEQGKLLLDSFFVGVRGIAASYPEHIKIVTEP